MPRAEGEGGPDVRHTHCTRCHLRLVPQRMWNQAPPAERAEMKQDGYARQGVGTHCARCSYTPIKRGRYNV